MNRTGLLIALAVAVAGGLVFGLYPALDIKLVAPFYEPRPDFWGRHVPLIGFLRDASQWLIALIVAPAAIALILKLVLPRRRSFMSLRTAVFLVATLAIGPGIVTNLLLKEYWHRPRPIDITEFKGKEHFRAWWDPRGNCPTNCSFVAGEPSGAFWTLAPASLAPPQWRALAYGGALAFGAFVGGLRLVAGGHFVSDSLFAGVLMFLVIWTAHGLIFRWPRTRLTDAGVEQWFERVAARIRRGSANSGEAR